MTATFNVNLRICATIKGDIQSITETVILNASITIRYRRVFDIQLPIQVGIVIHSENSSDSTAIIQ